MRRTLVVAILAIVTILTLGAATSCPAEGGTGNPPPPDAGTDQGKGGSIALIVSFEPPNRDDPVGISYMRPNGWVGYAARRHSQWYTAFTYNGEHVWIRASQPTGGTLRCRIVIKGKVMVSNETKQTNQPLVCDYKPVGRNSNA